MTRAVLLLGDYNVGKTHFGGQLLGRLARESGALRMPDPPQSLAPFDSVLDCLHDGRAAPHTPSSQYAESRWPIVNEAGQAADLVWPDYGGEQVRSIGEDRRMSPEWRNRVLLSDSWILMVRIHNAHVSDDIFSRPLADIAAMNGESADFAMSDQARIVDFLQWLLFIRRSGTQRRISEPQLLLLLSCWDELPPAERTAPPMQVLLARLPMVAAFVQSNWEEGSLHVLGLSALERSLSEVERDKEFVDKGPEAFGYVVLPDGQITPDLTLAISPLL